MKTIDEKAIKICEELKLLTDGAAFVKIRMALKEQDRDTRHACAEACLMATNGNDHLDIVSKAYHDICMNVQVV